ncbi:hypothetical protein BH11PSE13_BH11PSE13_41210 [soil metagenome]
MDIDGTVRVKGQPCSPGADAQCTESRHFATAPGHCADNCIEKLVRLHVRYEQFLHSCARRSIQASTCNDQDLRKPTAANHLVEQGLSDRAGSPQDKGCLVRTGYF